MIGALLVPFAAVALYARAHVIDPEVFADRAVEALDEPAVRRAVKEEIVGALLARTEPGVRPTAQALLSPRVDEIIASAAFRRLFRAAALDTNRRFFEEGGDTATVELGEVVPLVRRELRSVSPRLVRAVPRRVDVELVVLRRDEFPGAGAVSADNVRLVSVLLSLLALVAFALAMVAAPSRALAAAAVGAALVVAAALLAGSMLLTRLAVVAPRQSEGRLTEAELEDAIGALFDTYLSPLYTWALVIGLAGLVLTVGGLVLRGAGDSSRR